MSSFLQACNSSNNRAFAFVFYWSQTNTNPSLFSLLTERSHSKFLTDNFHQLISISFHNPSSNLTITPKLPPKDKKIIINNFNRATIFRHSATSFLARVLCRRKIGGTWIGGTWQRRISSTLSAKWIGHRRRALSPNSSPDSPFLDPMPSGIAAPNAISTSTVSLFPNHWISMFSFSY